MIIKHISYVTRYYSNTCSDNSLCYHSLLLYYESELIQYERNNPRLERKWQQRENNVHVHNSDSVV